MATITIIWIAKSMREMVEAKISSKVVTKIPSGVVSNYLLFLFFNGERHGVTLI